MKKLGIIVVSMVSFFVAGYFGMGLIDRKFLHKSAVLSDSSGDINPTQIPSETPSPIPSPTSTPLPTLTPKPKPTNTPTPIPQPTITSSEVHSFMERFAGQYGVDVNVLRHIAVCESGFNSLAINGPYAGLYQFNITTWKNNRRAMGEDVNPDLRFNAEEAIQTAAFLISQGKRNLWPNCYP